MLLIISVFLGHELYWLLVSPKLLLFGSQSPFIPKEKAGTMNPCLIR
jgi:hypothetical protein